MNKGLIIESIDTIKQTLLEVKHAQYSGSDWYTRGERGLFQQVRLHLDKADKAIKELEILIGVSNAN